MKLLIQIILLVALTAAFTQKNPEVKQIEFSKITRGYEEYIRINRDSVITFMHDMRKDKPAMKFARLTQDAEWVKLITEAGKIQLKDIETLPSPTLARASDGAMHGTITITDVDKKIYKHGFDDENPHASVKALLAAVREISGRKETK